MTSTQIDLKDYSYFADNRSRKAADSQVFEVHEPYSGDPFGTNSPRKREPSHVDRLDRGASTAFAEHNESQSAPGTQDTGRDLCFIFDNPELKKIEPWAGTHEGPQELADVFAAIQRCWKTLDFKVTDTIEQGSRVAFFGSFICKSNVTGREITSPFALLARFEGDNVAYVQFLEDSYGTAGSFKTGGATRFHRTERELTK